MPKTFFFALFFALLCTSSANAQIFFAVRDSVTISPNDTLFADGVTLTDNAVFVNNGALYVKGDWTNNNPTVTANGFTPASGGKAFLAGGNQNIGGERATHFPHLVFLNPSVKSLLQDGGAQTLDLSDAEFAVGSDTFTLFDPALDAIKRNSGYINMVSRGLLTRNMQQAGTYGFPLGANIGGQTVYRPLEIENPLDSVFQAVGVRFQAINADELAYFRDQKDSMLCEVNPEFYYAVNPINGAALGKLSFYYDQKTDKDKDILVNWSQNELQWNPVSGFAEDKKPTSDITSNGGISKPSALTVENFDFQTNAENIFSAAAQASYRGFVTNPVRTIVGEGITFVPLDKGNFSYFWDFGEGRASTQVEPALNFTKVGEIKVKLTVVNRQNPDACTAVYEKTVYIQPKHAVFPATAFSPNGDGLNDKFLAHFYGVTDITMKVYGRRGNSLYEGFFQESPIEWDGSSKEGPLPEGVYIVVLRGRTLENKEYSESGTITIVR